MSIPIIGRAIRDGLRENIVDPLGRPNSQWIHYKRVPANPSEIGKTPAMYIEPIPSSGGVDLLSAWRCLSGPPPEKGIPFRVDLLLYRR